MISAALMKGIISFQRKWGHDIIETANEEIITSVRLEESDFTSGLHWKIKFAHLFTLRSILTMQSASYSYLFMDGFFPRISLSIAKTLPQITIHYYTSLNQWKRAILDNLHVRPQRKRDWSQFLQTILQNFIQETLASLSNTRASFTREDIEIF